MALSYLLEMTNVGGAVTARGHEGAIELEGFTFSATNPAATPGGSSSGRADFKPVELYIADETALADFLRLAANGQNTARASLIGLSSDGTEVHRINLADVRVTSVQEQDGDGYFVSLAYLGVGVETATFERDGSLGDPNTFGFDLAQRSSSPPPPDATPGALVGGTNPDDFYMLVDGVGGGSTLVGHENWFELASFDFDVRTLISTGGPGSGSAGAAQFSPLTVTVENLGGLTRLLTKIGDGDEIAGLRIEGLNLSGDGASVTYRLNLADVHVTSIEDTGDQGYRVQFDYDRVRLDLFGQQRDGTYAIVDTFTWNLNTRSTNIGSLPTLTPDDDLPGSNGDIFLLKFGGVGGDSGVPGHPGAFNVTSFAFAGMADPPGDDGEAGAAEFGALTITLDDESGLARFLTLATNGQETAAVSLIGLRDRTGLPEVYRINLSDVIVTGVSEDAENGYQITLEYREIGVVTAEPLPSGGFGVDEVFGFDRFTGDTESPPPDATAGTGAGEVSPRQFFVLVDNVNGGSAVEGHERWFELESFNFDVTTPVIQGGVGVDIDVGQPQFGPVVLHLPNLGGLTTLLATVVGQDEVAGVRIEGVNNAGDVTYRLNLADVFVTSIEKTDNEGYDVTLDFVRVRLQTFAQQPDGSLAPPITFSFNRETGAANVGTLPTLAPAPGSGAPGTGTELFLEVTGLSGPEVARGVEGGFRVLSFDFGIEAPVSVGGPGGGMSGGRVDFESLTVELEDETGLADFLARLTTAQAFDEVSLIGRNPTTGTTEVFRVNLAEARVASVVETSDRGIQVTFEYDQIGVQTRTQQPDGAFGPFQSFGHDLVQNRSAPPPAPAEPGSPVGPSGAQDYVLLIDGVEGSSQRDGHEGWIEIESFSFDVEALLSAAGSGGSGGSTEGPPEFELLSVALPDFSGLTELLSSVALGRFIDGVRIEGLLNNGTRTYRLDLADVRVGSIVDDGGDGYVASFSYDRVRLTVYDQQPDGSVGPGRTFTWNLETHSPNIGTLPDIQPGGTPNRPPVAPDLLDRSFAEDAAVSFTVQAFTDADNDPLTYTATLENGSALPGWLSFNPATRQISGTPPANFNGVLAIKVTASDGTLSDSDVFSLTITPVNDAPTAVGDGPIAVNEDAATANLWSLLLGNDTDVDTGDAKTIVSVSGGNGQVVLDVGGQSLTYIANHDSQDLLKAGQSVADSFTYTMRDAAGATSTATVQVTVAGVADGATQTGGAAADTLGGTALDERVDGAAGNDSLGGGEGADTVLGGLGNDNMAGGNGIDSLSGADGADTVDGGAGNDVLAGGRGADLLVFKGRFGIDTAIDFRPGEDDILFDAAGFASFADVVAGAQQVGTAVVIKNAEGDALTLNNVQLANLQSGDFLFG